MTEIADFLRSLDQNQVIGGITALIGLLGIVPQVRKFYKTLVASPKALVAIIAIIWVWLLFLEGGSGQIVLLVVLAASVFAWHKRQSNEITALELKLTEASGALSGVQQTNKTISAELERAKAERVVLIQGQSQELAKYQAEAERLRKDNVAVMMELSNAIAKQSLLQNLSDDFAEINLLYRNSICRQFFEIDGSSQDTGVRIKEIIREEVATLYKVCSVIEAIFRRATGSDVCVMVRLIEEEPLNGEHCATTHARGGGTERRDSPVNGGATLFPVRTGANTCLDGALLIPDRHFFSANLDKDGKFYRSSFVARSSFYRSCLVVPICGTIEPTLKSKAKFVSAQRPPPGSSYASAHDIGFLSVDTLKPDVLNNEFHLKMLTALAAQMYPYLALRPGRYSY